MYVCMYVCTCVCVHRRIYMHLHTYIHTYMQKVFRAVDICPRPARTFHILRAGLINMFGKHAIMSAGVGGMQT